MEPFIAEIRPFAGNFAPTGWMLCNGQTLPIARYSALFSLLGTTYGGDGKVTFALPNLQGSVPIGMGQGPGLSDRVEGETVGSSTVTLTTNELPAHSHALNGSSDVAGGGDPGGSVPAGTSTSLTPYNPPSSAMVALSPPSILPTGSSFPHNNMQPYLGLTFIIATEGIYPSRG